MGVPKGEPPADGKVRARASQFYNVALLAGQDYAIFLYGDSFIHSHLHATTPLWLAAKPDASRLLEQLHEQETEEWRRFRQPGFWKECTRQASDEEAFAEATTVFCGRLNRTEEIAVAPSGDVPPTPVIEATFKVLDVLKGQAATEVRARSVEGVHKSCMPFPPEPNLVPGNDF
ncbi:MAG TPA: hypothetical protein VFZ16_07770 [Hyphomicrobiaceae bacterium]|nr:hypothetical protein [Hyphomicrobiaceae bacterium]